MTFSRAADTILYRLPSQGLRLSRGILLVNLGTPASPSLADVRRYLNEFLMDRHVLDMPWPIRRLIVSCFILPFRPRRSADAYSKIWTDEGSPLLVNTQSLGDAVNERSHVPATIAMRYGEPSIANAVAGLHASGVRELLLLPLFPQHANSTRTTAIEAVTAAMPNDMTLEVVAPFYASPDYIDCLAQLIETHLPDGWEHLLLSYHGLPERHLSEADPTGNHCLRASECCQTPSAAHATCYRHQCFETTRALTRRLRIEQSRYTLSFQSRLGRLPWLTPYTDQVLADLAAKGVKRLVVTCPAFVADNLETLEEIGIRGRDVFTANGGESLTLIPCLNANSRWVELLSGWCDPSIASISPRIEP